MKKILLTMLLLTLSVSMCACENKNKEVNTNEMIEEDNELDRVDVDYGNHKFRVTASLEDGCPLCSNDSYSILIEVIDKDDKVVNTRNRKNFCSNIECDNSYIVKAEKFNEPLPDAIIETIEEEINKDNK